MNYSQQGSLCNMCAFFLASIPSPVMPIVSRDVAT